MSAATKARVGVLALQGGYAAHQAMLNAINVDSVLVREPSQLAELDGLIIPGGESTTILKLLDENFRASIKSWYLSGGSLLGTCAGAILAAEDVAPDQATLGLIDISVQRNGYGRQIDSTVKTAVLSEDNSAIECVFIRAPRITRVGDQVKVLVHLDGEALCVQQQRCLVATYHPELTNDTRLHEWWYKSMGEANVSSD